MNDYSESATVAWLKFKPLLGELLTVQNEAFLRSVFFKGYIEGTENTLKITDKAVKK